MLKRTFTGAIVATLIYLWLFLSHIPSVLHCGTAILCLLSIKELYGVCGIKKTWVLVASWIAAAVILVLPIPSYEWISLLVFIAAVFIFALIMLQLRDVNLKEEWKAVGIALLLVLLFKTFPSLYNAENGMHYLTFAVTACFVTDVAAFLFGRSLGAHKLAPNISPNKTIEGAVGGLLATVMVAMIAAVILNRCFTVQFDAVSLVIWSVLVSVAGQFGDLCMSSVKRAFGVKDFGNILPGHGGILDRFDSHIFAVSFTLIFCSLTGGFIL